MNLFSDSLPDNPKASVVQLINLRAFQVVMNLFPFNPIGSLSSYATSNDQRVTKFQRILRGTCNIRTTARKQMGQDISGACGQLVVSLPDRKSYTNVGVLIDIEDLHK